MTNKKTLIIPLNSAAANAQNHINPTPAEPITFDSHKLLREHREREAEAHRQLAARMAANMCQIMANLQQSIALGSGYPTKEETVTLRNLSGCIKTLTELANPAPPKKASAHQLRQWEKFKRKIDLAH